MKLSLIRLLIVLVIGGAFAPAQSHAFSTTPSETLSSLTTNSSLGLEEHLLQLSNLHADLAQATPVMQEAKRHMTLNDLRHLAAVWDVRLHVLLQGDHLAATSAAVLREVAEQLETIRRQVLLYAASFKS